MDRTKASDAFNAGSIPVGCIYIALAIFMTIEDSRSVDSIVFVWGSRMRLLVLRRCALGRGNGLLLSRLPAVGPQRIGDRTCHHHDYDKRNQEFGILYNKITNRCLIIHVITHS